MIRVTPSITIDENEIKMTFICSSGPGGQNVNKVATAVQIRFDVGNSPSLPPDVRKRMIRLAGKRITENGVLILTGRRFRTQEQNRLDAIKRLIALIRTAAEKPKIRRRTKPPIGSKVKRLETKLQRGRRKQLRKAVSTTDE